MRSVAGSVNRSVSGLSSQIADRVSATVHTRSRTKTSASVRAPRQSRSTLRGVKGTWGGKNKDTGRGLPSSVSSSRQQQSAQSQPQRGTHQLFGVPLAELMARQATEKSLNPCHIPLPVNKLIEHVIIRGGREEGMLRIAASRDETDHIKQLLNNNKPVDLYAVNIHAIGDLLKSFIRDIPGGLLDSSKWDRWMAIAELESAEERSSQCKEVILELEHNNRALITVLFNMLHEMLRYERYTRMDANNLSKVFAPNVLQSADNMAALASIPKVAAIVATLITHYETIFRELKVQHPLVVTIDAKKAAALRPASKRALRSVPAVPTPAKKEIVAAVDIAPVDVPASSGIESAPQPPLKKQRSEGVVHQPMRKTTTPPVELARSNTYAGFHVEGAENEGGNSPRKASSVSMVKRGPANALGPMAMAQMNNLRDL